MDREICLVQDFWLSPPNLLPFTLRYGSKWLKSNIDYWFWMLSCQCLHFSLMQESRWIDASQVGPTYQSNETFKGHLIAHSAQFWSFLPAQSLSFDWMMWWIKSILKKHVRNLWHNNWKIYTIHITLYRGGSRIHPWVEQPKQYVQIWTHHNVSRNCRQMHCSLQRPALVRDLEDIAAIQTVLVAYDISSYL